VRGAGTIAEIDQLVGGLLRAEPLGERRWEQEPSAGDRVLVIEHDIDLVQHDVGGSHRKGALLIRLIDASTTSSSQAKGPFS
jgi:hypothetical protein